MELKLTKIACCRCSMLFWIDEETNKIYIEDKRTFYCPQGHGQSYRGESYQKTIKNLKDENIRLDRHRNNQSDEILRLLKKIQGYKGCIGKMKKRRGL